MNDKNHVGRRYSATDWGLDETTTYLNHGSFGPSPPPVRAAFHEWTSELERQPMHFFLRRAESALEEAAAGLASFVGCRERDLIFVENATMGMNIVAANVELGADDEVLVSDQEYGAVLRLWRSVCQASGARVVVGNMPRTTDEDDCRASQFLEAVTPRTRLIVVSHVTSPTAAILPVDEICRRAREQRIRTCIDGPHAVAMLPLNLQEMACDYYTASCHKWLSAPFGSGFLYVRPAHQSTFRPLVTSWGGSVSGREPDWRDEFGWVGTRNPAAFLSIPKAIEFLRSYGLDEFRRTTHDLALDARERIAVEFGQQGPFPEGNRGFGSMVTVELPAAEAPRQGHRDPLQDAIWQQHRIEVPIIHWQGRRFLRVSCHLYNNDADIDRLLVALRELL